MIENRTELSIGVDQSRTTVIDAVDKWRFDLGFSLEEIDADRPWGAFWRIPDNQVEQFMYHFFPKMLERPVIYGEKLSPKLLLVEPGKRLSWQYHERRAENWRMIKGNLVVKLSESNVEPEKAMRFLEGQALRIENGTRHRLISLGEWGLVAEIWTHTDRKHPSDEEDIVRLADEYGRESAKHA